MVYAGVFLMTFIGSLGAVFFKKSTENMRGVFSLLRQPSFYLGGFLYVSAAMLNVVLLRVMDYTVLYPMSAVSYIWSVIISCCFLGETITKKRVIGLALVIVGVSLLVK